MGYVIGTDEAGYGPNLGPLVVSASVWRVPGDPWDCDLYALLAAAVCASDAAGAARGRLVLADSKAIYKPATGIAALERGVLTLLSALGNTCRAWNDCWQVLAPDSTDGLAAAPWYAGYRCPLPLAADENELPPLAKLFRGACRKAGVRLAALRSRTVFPAEFNSGISEHGGKGAVLSRVTILLAAELLAALPDEPVLVICDKHGGRNFYGPLLQAHFPDSFVENHGDGRRQSVYRFGPPARRVEFRFRCRAEEFLPVASASMASKYLRELAMRAFNDFWIARVPELRPTAGYPGDARRFKLGIAAAQSALGVDDCLLWRER